MPNHICAHHYWHWRRAALKRVFSATYREACERLIPSAGNDWSGDFETRRRIAQWLVLSEEACQNTGFARQSSQSWNF